ncbi:MerR family transcriptional regulator [Streptomyces sp. NPDC059176]|uniref:MerR family transcriptional regulator n=1 Tax=Streptomyces sp. NPDC059176 TaxID=3346758 RepID=UPI0036BFEF74
MQFLNLGRTARLHGFGPDSAHRRADARRPATHRQDTGRHLVARRGRAALAVEVTHRHDGRAPSTTSMHDTVPATATTARHGDGPAGGVQHRRAPARLAPDDGGIGRSGP